MSFPEQRSLIQSYCKRNSINLIGETHEIQSRPVPSLPFISNIIQKYSNCDLIMVSRDCFYPEELERLSSIESVLSSRGNTLKFILQ